MPTGGGISAGESEHIMKIESYYGMTVQQRARDFIPSDKVNDLLNALQFISCKYHHTSLKRGYHTVKGVTIKPYNGRYGKGYTIESNNPNSTRYCCISYYIHEEE